MQRRGNISKKKKKKKIIIGFCLFYYVGMPRLGTWDVCKICVWWDVEAFLSLRTRSDDGK